MGSGLRHRRRGLFHRHAAPGRLGAARKNCPIQLFASDIEPETVRFAREGLYPESIAADVSEERLKRFFAKTDKSYHVTKQLREAVIFSVQNLITEPPFSRLDLVSCRNVLIYLEPDIQRRIITLFSFALGPGGYLFLGKSDGIAGQNERFATLSRSGASTAGKGRPSEPWKTSCFGQRKKRRPAAPW